MEADEIRLRRYGAKVSWIDRTLFDEVSFLVLDGFVDKTMGSEFNFGLGDGLKVNHFDNLTKFSLLGADKGFIVVRMYESLVSDVIFE